MKKLHLVLLMAVVNGLYDIGGGATIPLVNHGDAWLYHKGTNAPQADWKTVAEAALDSTAWVSGKGGFGYANNGGVTAETNNCGTILADMYNRYPSLYIRREFAITNSIPGNQRLYLKMDWDDAYIAWLDGVHLTNKNVAGAPAEPMYSAFASADHESSLGNNSPKPAEIYDIGPAANWLGPGTHILSIIGLNGGSSSSDFILVADLYLEAPPPPVTNVLAASNSPIVINTNVTIPANATLMIEPGTTVQFGAGVRVIADGQVVAVGTPENRIRLTRATSSQWSGFSFAGNHLSNVFAYVDFEYANGSGNGGTAVVYINDSQVTFERDTFQNVSGNKFMDIWFPQVTIRNTVFCDVGPSYMIMVENMNSNGWFMVDGNLFGNNTGDADIFHLNHVSVKNGPKAIIVNNVFTGAGDDIIDDNETDTHIEGNLFLNFTTNHPPRSAAAAVTTGEGSGIGNNLTTQHLTVVRNVFWGCDYAILNKDGSCVQVFNCVFANNRGAIIFDEPWRTDSGPGRACYIEGSIFWNNWPDNGADEGTFAFLTNNMAYATGRYYRGPTQVTVNNSILPAQYHYLGTGNLAGDPMFVFPTNILALSPTNPAFAQGFDGFDGNAFLFTNRLVPDVHLQPGSAAMGSGYNGSDMGIYVSDDATISGEPAAQTTETNATLTVAGLDIGGFKYRLVGPGFTNDWSPELQPWKYISQIILNGNTATATSANHGYSNGDVIEIIGADALCPYYNGRFSVTNVTADTFDCVVDVGTNAPMNEPILTYAEKQTDIWCRKPEPVRLSGMSQGTYRFEAIRKNSMGVWQDAGSPSVRTWTVGESPIVILTQPEGGMVSPGASYTLTVIVSGTPPVFSQWRKDSLDLPEATNQSFHIASATVEDAGIYSVVVSNSLGAVTSSNAVLSVGEYPVQILAQPLGGSIMLGQPYTFSVTVTGALPISYQWFKNSIPIAGATNGQFSLPAATGSDAGSYSVLVSNSANAVTSDVVELTVLLQPIQITAEPADQRGVQGDTVVLSVSVSGSEPVYQWFKSGSPIDGATGPICLLPEVQPAESGWYYVRVSNASNTVFSRTALVAVARAPLTLVAGNQTWRYDDTGAGPGAGWNTRDFDSTGWAYGAAPLGFPASEPMPAPAMIATVIRRYVGATSTQVNAYYFRTEFEFSNQLSGATITVSNLLDDGAVYSVNGQEVQRLGMAEGTVSYSTPASRTVVNPQTQGWEMFYLPAEALGDGTNTLAVEVHQASATSSDLVLASIWTVNFAPPSPLQITNQPASQTAMEGFPLTFTVGVSGGAGEYQWFKRAGTEPVAIEGAKTARLTLPSVSRHLDEGEYFVVVSNFLNQATSAVATLVITGTAPVMISQPLDQVVCEGGSARFGVSVRGSLPIDFQWFWNGEPIPDATNQFYAIPTVAGNNPGVYAVQASNAFGFSTSANASLRVTLPQPVMLVAPASVVTSPGSSTRFSVRAEGCEPLIYQWQFNGVNIDGAVGPQLWLTNLASALAGLYSVMLSNAFGCITSPPAQLTLMTEGEALNFTSLPLVLDHIPSWYVQGNVSHDGIAALQSGSLSGVEKCDVRITFTGPGQLWFWWRLDSADAVADLSFGLDGSDSLVLRGAVPWRLEIVDVPAGSHVAEWTFHLNNSISPAAGFLDEVAWWPGGQPPVFTRGSPNGAVFEGTNVLLRITAAGTPPLRYQWQWEGQEIPGATNASLRLPAVRADQAGAYTVWVTNAYGAAVTNILLAVSPTPPVFLPRKPYVLALPGGDAALRADAIGTPPLFYQWRFEGVDIPGATNAILNLYGVGEGQAGHYSVVVSNTLGVSTGPELELALSRVSRVIHISVDGLGGRWLETGFQNERERFPNLTRLQEEGATTCNARCDYFNSVTVPNHASILTGRPVLQPPGQPATVHHGYTDDGAPGPGVTLHNSGNLNVPYKASVFDVAHDYGLSTALLASKSKFSLYSASYNSLNGAPDTVPPDNGQAKIDYAYTVDSSSVEMVNRATAHLTNGAAWQYAFLHFADPDFTGHALGWGTPAYFDAVEQVDLQLGRLMAVIEGNPDPSIARETVIILTADHGGGGSAGVGGTSHSTPSRVVNFTIPLFVWGPGFPAGANLYSRCANRVDPGTSYVDYNAAAQPLRDGDSGNLALSLLGLPPIPGSSMLPVLRTARPALLTWTAPAPLAYGQPLGLEQFNAQADVAGTFVYDPPAGSILELGQHQLTAVFVPSDSYGYQSATTTVQITIIQATPLLLWTNPADIVYGTVLGATQLNVQANVPGTGQYTPAPGTLLEVGNGQILQVTFTPLDTVHYLPVTATVQINVLPLNQPPVAMADGLTTLREQPVSVAISNLLANDSDPDGDPLSLSWVSAQTAKQGMVQRIGDSLQYTPPPRFIGDDWFEYVIVDDWGHSATGQVHVVVNALQNPPLHTLVIERSQNSATLFFSGTSGQSYEIQFTDNFEGWTTLTVVSLGPSGVASFTDSPESILGRRFYRLRWQETLR